MFDRVRIRVEIFKEGDRCVSLCPELNVSSYGDTPEEARESLKEAVSLFLEECEHMGTLKDILEEAGSVMPLSESDTRAKLIDPALHARGWTSRCDF